MFTKAEVAKMSPEQQEILAQIELGKTRRRQKLLELARGLDWRSRYFPLNIFAVFIILLAFYYFLPSRLQNSEVIYLLAGMACAGVLISYITRLNRRVDALLELLDFDHKNQNGSDISKDEKPTNIAPEKFCPFC
jgi:hypothetical protein